VVDGEIAVTSTKVHRLFRVSVQFRTDLVVTPTRLGVALFQVEARLKAMLKTQR
jgi:hypothetical protein